MTASMAPITNGMRQPHSTNCSCVRNTFCSNSSTRMAQDVYKRQDKHLTAALNVNNVFDRGYYQSLSGTAWNNRYGEPRNVMLTLRAEY